MKELTERQWNDIAYRINSRKCPVCGYSGMYSEPNYGEIGNVDVLTVSCCQCGHMGIYDVSVLTGIADALNEQYIRNGQRSRKA